MDWKRVMSKVRFRKMVTRQDQGVTDEAELERELQEVRSSHVHGTQGTRNGQEQAQLGPGGGIPRPWLLCPAACATLVQVHDELQARYTIIHSAFVYFSCYSGNIGARQCAPLDLLCSDGSLGSCNRAGAGDNPACCQPSVQAAAVHPCVCKA